MPHFGEQKHMRAPASGGEAEGFRKLVDALKESEYISNETNGGDI